MLRYIWRLPAAAAFSLIIALAATAPGAQAAAFTVDSTGDGPDALTADAVCADALGACTLRAAIEQANFLPGPDAINFSIPGAGPHTIQPATPLPEITDQVMIDGYTEPGASVNTNPFASGTNAVIQIELDGSAGGGSGVHISAGLSTVRGLAINRFSAEGVVLESATAIANRIVGNFIGTDVTGNLALGNGVGVAILNGRDNSVGDTAPADRNVISGNISRGIRIITAPNTVVSGNYIGTNNAGTQAIPNSSDGILVQSATGATIGGTAPNAGNLLSGNGGDALEITSTPGGTTIQGNLIGTRADGVAALGNAGHGVAFGPIVAAATIGGTVAGAGNVIAFNSGSGIAKTGGPVQADANIRRNSIHSNAGVGIDLDGPAAPDVTVAASSATNTTVNGTLNGSPDSDYQLEFFASIACDPTGYGEGQTFIGGAMVTTDGSGNASFAETLPVGNLAGQTVTATATNSSNQTSDFSNCRAIPGPAGDDDNDGVGDAAEAACGGDATDPNIRPERIDGVFAGVSDDGDAEVDEALPPGGSEFDCDGDGYRGWVEAYVFTIPGQTIGDQKTCQEYDATFPNPAAHIRPSKRWPADIATGSFSGNKVNIQDLSSFTTPIRYINQDVGTDPGDRRFDLSPGSVTGNDIDVQDMATMSSGASGFPFMLHGARAFNGPQCPYSP